MTNSHPVKQYRIRITSGAEKGRYVGMRLANGFSSNPEVQKTPPKIVRGYGLWAQERGATPFSEANTHAVEAEFMAMGYNVELVEVKDS